MNKVVAASKASAALTLVAVLAVPATLRSVLRQLSAASRIRSFLWAITAMLVTAAPSLHGDTATYRLVIDNTWSEATHPGLSPEAAHFSWLGGGVHSDRVSFWQEGELASPGMVQMAETGRTDILVEEVDATVQNGAAFASETWHWWFCPEDIDNGSCGELMVEFEVNSEFPLVTLVTMLGPSPDWFVGTNGLSLRAGNEWLSSVTVDLKPYDGGTRSANVWDLGGPENNPPEPISLITEASAQLVGPASLGTMTFTLISDNSTAIEEQMSDLPEAFALDQNFPNPFNGRTAIRYSLPDNVQVELAVFNLTGQRVATLAQGRHPAGTYSLLWDGRSDDGAVLASGMYVYRLFAGEVLETRKLLLIR